jgi:pyridoxamine 5'-phosphate oxidase
MNIASIRKEYKLKELDHEHLLSEPIEQFELWLKEAIEADANEPTAMNLSTVDTHGQPHARIVLLKGIQDGFFQFFTNYDSAKGQDLQLNNKAALTFFWPELERQVRILGRVEKLDTATSDVYFYSRPIDSQWGACASPQSQQIESRQLIEQNLIALKEQMGNKVKRPENWGGYGLIPHYFEFWQGRESRLHDRLVFEKTGFTWKIARLAP